MEIDNAISQVSSPLLGNNTITLTPASKPDAKTAGFGPAFEISLSKEAKSLYASTDKNSKDDPFVKEAAAMLQEAFDSVSEILSFSHEAGKEGSDQIQAAGKAFQDEVLKIAQSNDGKPLTDKQLIQILEAEEKFHQVVDKAFGFDEFDEDSAGFGEYGDFEDEAEGGNPQAGNQNTIRDASGKELGAEELAEQEATLAQAGASAGNAATASAKARIATLEAQLRAKKVELKAAEDSQKVDIKSEITRLETEVKTLKEKQKKA